MERATCLTRKERMPLRELQQLVGSRAVKGLTAGARWSLTVSTH